MAATDFGSVSAAVALATHSLANPQNTFQGKYSLEVCRRNILLLMSCSRNSL